MCKPSHEEVWCVAPWHPIAAMCNVRVSLEAAGKGATRSRPPLPRLMRIWLDCVELDGNEFAHAYVSTRLATSSVTPACT
jgi:hypothetical protein